MIYPLLLSGGTGSRLWPLSRVDSPKQFLALSGKEPMIVETAKRVSGKEFAAPIIVAGEAHRFHAAACMEETGIKLSGLILEPSARNTAPAIALGALHALTLSKDAVILVCPADHIIENENSFRNDVIAALPAAQSGSLVTFGIKPLGPETGFGYIKQGKAEKTANIFKVDRFIEKPEAAAAQEMLDAGGFHWNAGIFLMRADAYLSELGKYEKAILTAAKQAMEKAKPDLDFIRPHSGSFNKSPSISIDYAVMEKTSDAVVSPIDASWSDIGSWDALFESGERDENGVTAIGDVITHGVKNSYLRGETRMIAGVGLENIAVVETTDAILVADLKKSQDVKHIFEKLKAANRREAEHHTHVERPWGSFETLALGTRFQVKRIIVKPGGVLSLQKHHHRSEHWVVVEGTAMITIGEEKKLVTENESVYIPLGEIHRMENPGKFPMVLIEVQTGSYLGEDDIVRIEDVYQRVEN